MTAAATVTIRPMSTRHLTDVERLDRAVQQQPWSREMLHSELRQPESRRYVVALVGEKVIGFGGVFLVPPEAHVTTIGVAPRHQKRGVGAMLLTALVHASTDGGATELTLEVRPSNTAALALYRRCGFLIEGRRPRYYDDGEDALIMWRRNLEPARTESAPTGATASSDRS